MLEFLYRMPSSSTRSRAPVRAKNDSFTPPSRAQHNAHELSEHQRPLLQHCLCAQLSARCFTHIHSINSYNHPTERWSNQSSERLSASLRVLELVQGPPFSHCLPSCFLLERFVSQKRKILEGEEGQPFPSSGVVLCVHVFDIASHD